VTTITILQWFSRKPERHYSKFFPMKNILTLLFCCLGCALLAQQGNAVFGQIKTVLQAEAFLKKTKVHGNIFSITSSTDTSQILVPLYNQKIGFQFVIGDSKYKILEMDSVLSFRANYIYLSGEKYSRKEIDSIRMEIISKYQAGENFFQLVQQYNMDANLTGDTKWFSANMMVKEFEDAVRSHRKGDIFTVDMPDLGWYHVVLKTYNTTYIKKATLLAVRQ
jgi:hypothetical protein